MTTKFEAFQITDSSTSPEWGVRDKSIDSGNPTCRGCTEPDARMIAASLNQTQS